MSGRTAEALTRAAGGGNGSASGSVRGPGNPVKLAGEESKDKLYEPKHSKKLVRVLTVVAYMFSVSLAAIMLSVYYVFLWNPRDPPYAQRGVVQTSSICPTPVPVQAPPTDTNYLPQVQQQKQQAAPPTGVGSPSFEALRQEQAHNLSTAADVASSSTQQTPLAMVPT